jgi:RimJ/RimL family protein N-acetyltransferase
MSLCPETVLPDLDSPARRVLLPGGVEALVRPIHPDDAPALQRFHSGLSARSVYMRFFELLPRLSDDRAAYFTHLDGADRHALVALNPARPDEILGVVRYDREPGADSAEYAAVLGDAWQGRGLGIAMTRLLIADARTRGIRRLFALTLPENTAMLTLFRALGLQMTVHWDEQALRVDLDITTDGPCPR